MKCPLGVDGTETPPPMELRQENMTMMVIVWNGRKGVRELDSVLS